MDADGSNDPFVSPAGPRQIRFSNFDNHLYALGPPASPGQAKRALEAHLAETERRMEEVGKLGTALVDQQKTLAERLREVEKLQAEGDLTPELRMKLSEIEKEYHDVARETARAFLPKQRVPSNEAAGGSPYVPESRSGKRSVSPSKFESHATGSPTKLSVPNRKIRNQPATRVHDIEFAAEISTSLLAQVRNLQSLLAEKDGELRDIKAEKSRLEIEAESFQQRVKTLDESEHRYKDENWNLETQIHELIAAQKESADREKKLTQSLNILQVQKNQTQKELDEVKLSHAGLVEEHEASVKQHDIELGTAKRNAILAEAERVGLQRKIDDLMGQNQELAKAISAQRARALERESNRGTSDDDFETATDNATPDHSPPASPIKGTPRHSILESETLKTSLLHAQRTIQTQRSQLHREKTEKLELRRLLQDNRDELEKLRNDAAGVSNRRGRKPDSREFKKPSRNLLGGSRAVKSEVFMEDPDWEEHPDSATPRHSPTRAIPFPLVTGPGAYPLTTDNETSDAFETANERGTETEDFQTGAEEFSEEDDDAETETETPSKNRGRGRPPSLNLIGTGSSFHRTASTSADEDFDDFELRTPISHSQQRMRVRSNRSFLNRRSRQPSEEPGLQSSPISRAASSPAGTPQQPAQSLFAELAGLEGSDVESLDATPSRSVRSMTPASVIRNRMSSVPPVPPLPGLVMVDSGIMTDPLKKSPLSSTSSEPDSAKPTMVDCGVMTDASELPPPPHGAAAATVATVAAAAAAATAGAVLSVPTDAVAASTPTTAHLSVRDDAWPNASQSRPESMLSYSDAGAQYDTDIAEKLDRFPMPPSVSKTVDDAVPPTLVFSPIENQAVEPVEQPQEEPPALTFTAVESQDVQPVREPEVPPPPAPVLGLSTIASEHVEPRSEPEVVPALDFSPLVSELIEPKAEPEIIPPPPVLSFAPVISETTEPKLQQPEDPSPAAPLLVLSSPIAEGLEPQVESEAPSPPPTVLTLSPLFAHDLEPRAEPEVKLPVPEYGFTALTSLDVEPQVEPEPPAPVPPALTLSVFQSEQVEPRSDPEPEPTPLTLTGVQSWDIEPRADPEPAPPSLTMSTIVSEAQEPVSLPIPSPPVPQFTLSAIDSIETEPVAARSPKRDAFIIPRGLDSIMTEGIQPRTPDHAVFDSAVRRGGKSAPVPDVSIAEDETRQSPSDPRLPESPESQRPFKEISSNSTTRARRKQAAPMLDQSAQTFLTAHAIGEMFEAKTKGHDKSVSVGSSVGSPDTVRIHRFSRDQDSVGTPGEHLAHPGPDAVLDRRRRSASSSRGPAEPLPPLPPNHKATIAAARTGSAQSNHGSTTVMGPPLWPASAMRAQRPRTPNRPQSPPSIRGTPTPRATRPRVGISGSGTALAHSPTKASARSRRSSVSSFVSELDTRFNIRDSGMGMNPNGFGPNTDPRMIQAITQTMIGEYLWKYTRKTGRGDMSEYRHRRYFWVHPYTRTLYWSDRDPTAIGRSEAKAKSVPIEAVRVVTDDNPSPPGLHRKSLIVISPNRVVKFTCPTGQRHETWFNALSYLLLRTNEEGQSDAEEMAGHITQADVDEFNPQVGVDPSVSTARQIAPPSLSSYHSRTTQNQSPAIGMSMNVPRLTPTPHKETLTHRPSQGTLSKISGYWKNSQVLSGTFSSIRSRNASHINHGIYEASEVRDSVEDEQEMMERMDREADRLENVRACCDGKHDVSTLPHYPSYSKRGRPSHTHSHSGPSASAGTATPTPMSTMRSRV
ncbi:hypothetical protein ACRALDRAFT_2098942 [Sodiomyces alcalophilus JCM 7366]|uniref:uncharacterized protein n=1 Tax=Sodiomyces alcalophilus JCM 7366 TaxID=591952 RepID=UPI0039B69FFA